jgi:hypothetical protein
MSDVFKKKINLFFTLFSIIFSTIIEQEKYLKNINLLKYFFLDKKTKD